ncbi:DUF6498-containing protein [Haladaptatus cibarius]|uniref:DUF6498-containing protein n=1 Tax=Haladaptatus cibarius TaxID=453847 RepID=UPI000678F3C4|nr:DUF6498-containing protein [Haladaptatus cibarius]
MSATRYGNSPSTVIEFLPVLLANLLPLAGVLWLGWNPETLAAVYALELLFLFPLAGVKALFAGRPPVSDRGNGVVSVSESDLVDKRGSVTIHDRIPPIYPRTVPFATAVVSGGAWVGVFVIAPLSDVISMIEVFSRPEVLVSVVALLVAQLAETAYSYIRRGQYADLSPYAVVEIPARQGFFLAFLLFFVLAAGATFVLVGFVFMKVLFEWSGFRAECGGGGRLTRWLSGPNSDSMVESVAVPEGQFSTEIDADRRSVVVAAVWRTITTTGPFYVTMTGIVWVASVAFLSEGEVSLTLWLGVGLVAVLLFGIMLAGDIVEDVLTSGWMTYRRTGDQLVAYDRLTDELQWVTPVDVLRDAEVVKNRPSDRYFRTRTITVTTGWGNDETERTLGPVSDPELFVETFDIPIRSTDLSPLNRWFAGVAVASGIFILVGAVALVVTSFGSPGSWLFVAFLFPFFTAIPMGFWKLAHSY